MEVLGSLRRINFFRVGLSAILLCITSIGFRQPLWIKAPFSSYLILFLSGIISIAISDTLFHASLNRVGAGLSAIIDCLYSPFTVIFAVFFLKERLGVIQFIGMSLVLMSVAAAAQLDMPALIAPGRLLKGLILGVLAMVTLAFGIVIAKPVLNETPVLWATTMRQFGGLLVMLPMAAFSSKRRLNFGIFKPSSSWRHSLPGAFLGSYCALILWIASNKYAQVGIAAILSQAHSIFVLFLAAIFLKEPLTSRKLFASLTALIGIGLVVFF